MRLRYVVLSLTIAATALEGCGHGDLITGSPGNPVTAYVRVPTGQSATTLAPAYYAIALPSGFVPYAIMRDGQVPGSDAGQAAVYNNGSLTLLASDPNCESGTATATSVNAHGQAVGYCTKGQHALLALYFATGTVRELRRPGTWQDWGIVQPLGITDSGDIYGVAGNWFDSSFPYVTRFFSDGRAAQVNTQVVAEAANLFVNNTGHYAFTNFSYPNGTFAALGFGTSVFRVFPNQVGDGMAGINDSGAAVGYTMAGRTFIRAAGGGVTFLPFPTGITSMSPYGINNAGQVIGQACSSQRCSEVFLYSSGNVIDLATRISPQNDYSLLNGLSDGGAFLAQDPQGNRDVIEPVKPLFVANSSNTVTAYVPPYTGAPISTTSYFVSAPDGMAFDGKRNLYVANSGTNDVTEYAPPYIAEPIATIKNGINQPKGVAFDRSTGDLFVACADSVQIYAPPYTGTPIGRLTNAVNHPDAVAFDSKRDLFVSNIGNSTITIYQPPYTGAPTVTISKGRAYPRSLALNARGDLFVGFDTKYEPPTEEVVEYAPPYTGAPIATITDDVNAPYGLAVDGSGDLFVANFSNNNVTAYAPPYTGAPFATISTGVSTPNGLAFGP